MIHPWWRSAACSQAATGHAAVSCVNSPRALSICLPTAQIKLEQDKCNLLLTTTLVINQECVSSSLCPFVFAPSLSYNLLRHYKTLLSLTQTQYSSNDDPELQCFCLSLSGPVQ